MGKTKPLEARMCLRNNQISQRHCITSSSFFFPFPFLPHFNKKCFCCLAIFPHFHIHQLKKPRTIQDKIKWEAGGQWSEVSYTLTCLPSFPPKKSINIKKNLPFLRWKVFFLVLLMLPRFFSHWKKCKKVSRK